MTSSKASPAGTTHRQATGLGRIARGADATRVPSPGAVGRGAPARLPLLVGLTFLLALAFASGASAAGVVVNSIGGTKTGTTGEAFNTARGVAVNQSGAGGVAAGTFYVVDTNNNRVQRFTPAGAFVSAWGWGVKDGAGEYELCTQAAECGRGTSGTGAGQFGNNGAQGIAVDQGNGNVYVSDQVDRRIDVFSAAGIFIGGFGWGARDGTAALQFCTAATACHAPGTTAPASGNVPGGQFGSAIGGLAVDESHDVYVANKTSRRVDVFKPTFTAGVPTGIEFQKSFGWGAATGAAAFEVCAAPAVCHAPAAAGNGEGQFALNSPTDIGIDSEGNVFALDGPTNKRVQEFSPAAAPLSKEFGAAALSATFGTGEPLSIAIDRSDDHVFVSGKRSTASNQVAVLEMDHGGAAVQAYGEELTPTGANGLAVAQASLGGNVYLSVATNNTLQGVYAMNSNLPTVSAPSSVTAHSATLHGTVVSDEVAVAYHFEYSTDGANWTAAPASDATVPATPGAVAVEQAVSGLVGSQEYRVRLAATRPAGATTIRSAATSFTTEPSAPEVIGSSASRIGIHTARLEATINPENQPTVYRFQVGPESCSANACPTLIEGSAGFGGGPTPVVGELTGLAPGTTYHFRVVAINADGMTPGLDGSFTTYSEQTLDTSCSNQAFRTGFGAFLPDCRAYEQASPVDKNGVGVGGIHGFTRSAPLGGAITFFDSQGNGFPSETGGNQTYGTYQASRKADAWPLQRLMAPASLGTSNSSSWLGSTPDLRYSLVEVENPDTSSPEFGRGLYLLENQTGAITQVVAREKDQTRTPYAFDGASTDGARIFFETTAALTSDAVGTVDHLYMWSRATGEVSLVGVLPASEGGEEPEGGSFGGAYEWFEYPETETGGALQGLGVEALHAISPTGDQIYFTAGETGQLYLRRGLTGSSPETVRVSAPAPGAPIESPLPAAFQEATPGGSYVFFLSSQKLTGDATTGPADEGKDLYRWDAESEHLVDIAPDTIDPEGADVRGLVGVAEDGRSGYFVAAGDLATGATAGRDNLYRFVEADGQFDITFIATLAPHSRFRGEINIDERNYSPRAYDRRPSEGSAEERMKDSRMLADGSELLFSSAEPLTGYENIAGKSSRGIDICSQTEARCGELFLYSASTGNVICISCSPSGEPPLGPAQLNSELFNVSLYPNDFPNVYLPRNLSADGEHIFFESPDPLVPRDTNAAAGCTSSNEEDAPGTGLDCLDVYEWEAVGAPGGSCKTVEADGGCLYLLSTGQSPSSSYFLDASQSGSEVFIATTSRLVPSDRDSVYDVYDVTSDGGLASQFQVPGPPCEGEACLGQAASPPAAGNAASSLFEGPGNPTAKKHHRKRHHKKRHHHHKKRHHKKKAGSRPGHHGRSGDAGSKGGN